VEKSALDNFAMALRLLERAEAEENPAFTAELIALAEVRASLAIVAELSALGEEVHALRRAVAKVGV